MSTEELPLRSQVLDRIRSMAAALSPSERRVADAILSHAVEALNWSASELGSASGTSAATAVRATRRLGFDGLGELRLALARDLGWNAGVPVTSSVKGRRSVVSELFEQAGAALPQMVGGDALAEVRRAVELLASADRILAVAAGPSTVFAQDFVYWGRISGLSTEFWPDVVMQSLAAAKLSRRDACLVVSASGVNALAIAAAERALASGAKVVAVTGYRSSVLSEIASVTVVTDALEYSTVAQAAISSAGLLLMLRGLVIQTVERATARRRIPAGYMAHSAEELGNFARARPAAPPPGANGP